MLEIRSGKSEDLDPVNHMTHRTFPCLEISMYRKHVYLVRDWSLITGRGGGRARKLENCGSLAFYAAPTRQAKTFSPPF